MYTRYKISEETSIVLDSIWTVDNTVKDQESVKILPDSYLKLLLFIENHNLVKVKYTGLFTEPQMITKPANTLAIGCSLNILAPEYIFNREMSPLLNQSIEIPSTFLEINEIDFSNTENAVKSLDRIISKKIASNNPTNEKITLSNLIYAEEPISVSEIAEKCGISSKQLNRYFSKYLGVPLKQYLNIRRLYKSFFTLYNEELKQSNLPYFDQAHFIKEFKRYTSYTPGKIKHNSDSFHDQFKINNF